MSDEIQVRDLEEAKTHLASLTVRVTNLERRMVYEEGLSQIFILTPWWKKVLFWLDGWSGHARTQYPQWRPWRKWFTS